MSKKALLLTSAAAAVAAVGIGEAYHNKAPVKLVHNPQANETLVTHIQPTLSALGRRAVIHYNLSDPNKQCTTYAEKRSNGTGHIELSTGPSLSELNSSGDKTARHYEISADMKIKEGALDPSSTYSISISTQYPKTSSLISRTQSLHGADMAQVRVTTDPSNPSDYSSAIANASPKNIGTIGDAIDSIKTLAEAAFTESLTPAKNCVFDDSVNVDQTLRR